MKHFLCGILIAYSPYALSQDETVVLYGFGNGDGEYEYLVRKDRMETLWRWLSTEESPPLSTAEALTIAREEIGRKCDRSDLLGVTEISLKQFLRNREAYPDIWFYVVRFFPLSPEVGPVWPHIVVLMDGSVVEVEFIPRRGHSSSVCWP